jgi:hypothetical protein
MRLDRDELAFLGLIALDEMVMKCREGPQERPISLRATLAMLYVLGGRGDRGPFDAFWTACLRPKGATYAEEKVREQEMNRLLRDICAAVGFEPRPELTNKLIEERSALRHETTITRMGVKAHRERQARFAEIFRETAKALEEERERRRMGHDCKLRG